MAAPKGNQYAVGNPNSGRPSKYDLEKIAVDLVIWAKNDDSVNFNKFCFNYDPKIPPPKLSEWANKDEVFKEAYDIAKSALGYRREEMLSNETLHVKAYDLNAAVYDFFLKQEKRDQAEFESNLKKQENQSQNDDLKAEFKALMGTMSEAQKKNER